MITSAAIASATAIGTAIAQGVSNKKNRERTEDNTRKQVNFAVSKLNDLLKTNKIGFDQWLTRFTTIMDSQKSDVRGIMQNALSSGLQNINDQTQLTLNQIHFQIDEAKKNATVEEKKVLDQAQERVKELATENRVNSREIKNSFTQQGLNGGALAAAMSRNLNNLNEAVVKITKLSNDQISDIKDRVGSIERTGIFQLGQTGLESTIQKRTLQTDIANNEAAQLSNLELQKQNTIAAREQNFNQNQQDIIGEAIKLGASGVGAGGKKNVIDIAGAF